ncbi:hypothetical protein [Nocardia sp. alder85J]|uniref:hypothetical protein n=1 Tax=Nocardia sp. alder85J TaxID=2862949 RepID=UPI001CD70340|nr:hypothetical protein [Nocardia sp. alder85J]MCX4097746.1 hypothetical protein [Nocardia sp. alder85J]
MPRPLGVSVVTALCDSGRPVPAVSHTASVVALLTDSTAAETPQRSGRVDTAAGVRQRRLWCRGVVWVRGGAPIVLPYPGDPRRRWLQPPNGSTITAGDAAIVIAAAIESEEAAAAAHARANRRERVHAR